MSRNLQATRLDAAKAKTKDRAKMTVLVAKPAEGEVEGQSEALVNRPVECPWCGATGYVLDDLLESDYAQCGSCGQFVNL
jgi:hypothetical protein